MLKDLFILLENGTCVSFMESSAQPEDPECIGCIEIYAYDKNGNETGDCGEFEYHEGVYECMQDAVKDGLQFSNFPMNIPYKEISEEEFYKRIAERKEYNRCGTCKRIRHFTKYAYEL